MEQRTRYDEWSLWSTTARLVVTKPRLLAVARELCDGILSDIDRATNRFDPTSELSRLRGDGAPTEISPLLAELVREARVAAERTGGAVDPTVGTALDALGYDRDIELLRHDGAPPLARVTRVPGWRRIHLLRDRLFLPPGTQLDLGATATASAADRCARAVHRTLGTGVLVSLGGELAIAGPTPHGGWQVHVKGDPDDLATSLTLGRDSALATSNTRLRRWTQDGVPRHHLIDPVTAQPVPPCWRTVSVVARTCLDANTAATAAIVKREAALPWLARLGFTARLVADDGRVHHTGGWPHEVAA